MDPFLLTTIAAQVGSSLFNCLRGNKNAKALAERQQAYEEKVTRDGIARAREEFAQICALQREMEQQLQADRLNLIKENYQDTITLLADEKALQEWPLFVPPYVVKNECILDVGATVADRFMLPLNCILTTSADRIFNQRIFPKLEEWLAIFCTGYWNVSAEKSIRFFQGAWRNNSSDVGAKIYNLYNGLSDVPTFVLSPVIRDGKVLFRFYWWGLSQNPNDIHIDDPNNIFDPELGARLTDEFEYTEDDINEMVNELGNKLAALVSFFADMYYWNFYKEPPLLMALLQSGVIALTQSETKVYVNEYGKLLAEYIDNSKYSTFNSRLVLETISNLSYYNDSEILNQILSTVISNKEFLYTSDLPVVKGLSKIKSSLSHDLSEIALNLEKGEAITVHPFSSTKEMFYNIQNIFDFPTSKDKELHLKFINEYAFICSVVDNSETNLYSSLNSRFHLFITYNKIPLSIYKAGILNTENQNFTKIDPESSPCSQLVYDGDNIIRIIRQVRDFLLESQDLFNQIYASVSPSGVDSTTSLTTTYDDIKRWISANWRGEKEFRLLLSYNTQKQYYMIVGRFVDGDDIVEDRTYVSRFSFLDDSIKRLLNYNCVFKLNIN